MMAYDGKKEARMRLPAQVRSDPRMVSAIIDRASRNNRSPGNEVLHLLICGLLHDPDERRKERVVDKSHAESQEVTEEKVDGHFPAQPGSVRHVQSRRKQA